MAEEVSFGVRRLRQAITNQAACGSGQLELSIDSADRLCRECEDELAMLSWAQGVPAPVDADGEVVPLTTKVMNDGVGRELDVRRLGFASEGHGEWVAFCAVPPNGMAHPYDLDELHLHRPDSWERLEEDVERFDDLDACAYYNCRESGCVGCRAAGARNCGSVIACDILRRAKALAGRDGKEASRG